jgi:hypothetical protein
LFIFTIQNLSLKITITNITTRLACLLLFACAHITAYSQKSDSTTLRRSFWLGFGYGASTNRQSISGLINNVNLNYQLRGNRLITFNAQGDLGEQVFYTPGHITNISAFDILGGKIYTGNSSLFIIQAGLGLVHAHSYDRTNIPTNIIYNETNRYTLGIPLSVHTYLVGFKAMGIGIGAWANLNLIQPVAGINLNYAFGRIITPTRPKSRRLRDSLGSPSSIWTSFGLGANSTVDSWGRFDVNVEIPHRWLLTGNVAKNIGEHLGIGPDHITNHTTTDLLLGKLYKHNNYLFSASAGLGLVHFNNYDTDGTPGSHLNQSIQNTIGIPVLVQGYLVGYQTMAVGIGGYANFNTVRTEAGITLSIAFGRMTAK